MATFSGLGTYTDASISKPGSLRMQSVEVTLNDTAITVYDSLDCAEYIREDVELIYCVHVFPKDHGTAVEFSNGKTVWIRWKDASMASTYLNALQRVWPCRTAQILEPFEAYVLKEMFKKDDVEGIMKQEQPPRRTEPITPQDKFITNGAEATQVAPPQTGIAEVQHCSYCSFQLLLQYEAEARRRLERGLLLQYIQNLVEMVWQLNREVASGKPNPLHETLALTGTQIPSGLKGLEQLTPEGSLIAQEAEKRIRATLGIYHLQQITAAQRQERLEAERWDKLQKQRDADSRRDYYRDREVIMRELHIATKDVRTYQDKCSKESERVKKLTAQITELKEREAQIVSVSRKREGELHAMIYKLKKDATPNAAGPDTPSSTKKGGDSTSTMPMLSPDSSGYDLSSRFSPHNALAPSPTQRQPGRSPTSILSDLFKIGTH